MKSIEQKEKDSGELLAVVEDVPTTMQEVRDLSDETVLAAMELAARYQLARPVAAKARKAGEVYRCKFADAIVSKRETKAEREEREALETKAKAMVDVANENPAPFEANAELYGMEVPDEWNEETCLAYQKAKRDYLKNSLA